MAEILHQFIHTSQVVQDFSHQQYYRVYLICSFGSMAIYFGYEFVEFRGVYITMVAGGQVGMLFIQNSWGPHLCCNNNVFSHIPFDSILGGPKHWEPHNIGIQDAANIYVYIHIIYIYMVPNVYSMIDEDSLDIYHSAKHIVSVALRKIFYSTNIQCLVYCQLFLWDVFFNFWFIQTNSK